MRDLIPTAPALIVWGLDVPLYVLISLVSCVCLAWYLLFGTTPISFLPPQPPHEEEAP